MLMFFYNSRLPPRPATAGRLPERIGAGYDNERDTCSILLSCLELQVEFRCACPAQKRNSDVSYKSTDELLNV